MGTGLKIKEVNFDGATLLGVQDEQEIIWAGVKWICEGIGLSIDQIKNERKKIQSDLILSQGGLNLTLPTNGGEQKVLALQLDYVPLWLAKISITPTMRRDNPEVVKNLVDYQLKAKDVLAAAFLPQYQKSEPLITKTEIREILRDETKQIFISELQQFKSEIFNQLQRVLPSPSYTDWKTEVNKKVKRLSAQLKTTHNLVLSNLYKELTKQYKIDINRLKNIYMQQNNLERLTTLDFIELHPHIKEKFDITIDSIFTTYAQVQISDMNLFTADPIKLIIRPLIEKYSDASKGGCATFRKVYKNMDVKSWSIRKTRYKNEHKLKKDPSKNTLIKSDKKLMKNFKDTVEFMLSEV